MMSSVQRAGAMISLSLSTGHLVNMDFENYPFIEDDFPLETVI